MKKILGVVRASTEHQEIVSQKAELSSYITSLGYNDEDIQWIEVAGASARKANKKYLEMLQDIKDAITTCPTIKAAAFWHLNRLGRIDTYIISMKNWFIENKIQVYVKNPTLTLLNEDGTTNAGAEIAWGVFATMVKLETQEMFEKVKRGKQRNKAEGLYNGGGIKYGYKLNTATQRLEYNEEEVDLIKLIFAEYTTSKTSTSNLAEELTSRGYTNRGGKINARWIGYILNAELYKDIIGEDTFNKAQTILKTKYTKRKTKVISLCAGLITCPNCGGRLFANSGKGYMCYNHYGKSKGVDAPECDRTTVINDIMIDNLAFEIALMGYADFMAVSNREALEDLKKDIAINRQKLSENQRRMEKADGQRDRIKKLFIMGDIGEKEYKKLKADAIAEYNDIMSYNLYYHKTITELDNKIALLERNTEGERVMQAFEEGDKFTINEAYDIVHKFITNITYEVLGNGVYKIFITTITGAVWTFKYNARARSESKVKIGKDDEWRDFHVKVIYANGCRVDKIKYL